MIANPIGYPGRDYPAGFERGGLPQPDANCCVLNCREIMIE